VRFTAILLGCAALAAPALAQRPVFNIPPATAFALRIVEIHNRVRSGVGVAPIAWDPSLAAGADRWAAELARTGRFEHSPPALRPGQGENLWMGTRGAYGIDQMVGSWAGEGRWFRPGVFPNVSRGGGWSRVGHYTQMIWRVSTRVGCAMRSSARYDYLVCRYAPAGNVLGVTIP
jgi:hypothetical protein